MCRRSSWGTVGDPRGEGFPSGPAGTLAKDVTRDCIPPPLHLFCRVYCYCTRRSVPLLGLNLEALFLFRADCRALHIVFERKLQSCRKHSELSRVVELLISLDHGNEGDSPFSPSSTPWNVIFKTYLTYSFFSLLSFFFP